MTGIPVDIQGVRLVVVHKTSANFQYGKVLGISMVEQIFIIFARQRRFHFDCLAFAFRPSNGACVRPATISASFSQTALSPSTCICLNKYALFQIYDTCNKGLHLSECKQNPSYFIIFGIEGAYSITRKGFCKQIYVSLILPVANSDEQLQSR